MNYVPSLNTAVCQDCTEEWPLGCMSYIHPASCALCAMDRIAAENAARAIEIELDAAAEAADEASDAEFPQSLILGTEPLFSAERDSRELSSR